MSDDAKPTKPKMPDPRPTITLGPITAKLDMSNKFSSGSMRMVFSDTTVTVSEGDKDIGDVSGCIGGGLQLRFGTETFFVSAVELWRVFSAAVQEQWIKEEAK